MVKNRSKGIDLVSAFCETPLQHVDGFKRTNPARCTAPLTEGAGGKRFDQIALLDGLSSAGETARSGFALHEGLLAKPLAFSTSAGFAFWGIKERACSWSVALARRSPRASWAVPAELGCTA